MDTGKSSIISKDTYKTLVPLPSSFYRAPTQEVARGLLGQLLVRNFGAGVEQAKGGDILAARIVEVEAYTQEDPACHAFNGPTKRCQVMFGPPGYAYVYFIYGMYHCLNVVTEDEGRGCAVLIRGLVAPFTNKSKKSDKSLLGPGKICRNWGIDLSHNGLPLFEKSSPVCILRQEAALNENVRVTPRIGISKGVDLEWRYVLDLPK